MHHKAIPQPHSGCNPPSTAGEDTQTQRAVLALVLDQHPAALTICEIAREMDREGDEVERAIRDLVGAGLLRCEGASVLPTRATLHADRLEGE
jgi:predicted transcriptional regulator